MTNQTVNNRLSRISHLVGGQQQTSSALTLSTAPAAGDERVQDIVEASPKRSSKAIYIGLPHDAGASQRRNATGRPNQYYLEYDPRMESGHAGGTVKLLMYSLATDRTTDLDGALYHMHSRLKLATRAGYRQPAAFEPYHPGYILDQFLRSWNDPFRPVELYLEYCHAPTPQQQQRFFSVMERERPDIFATRRQDYEKLFEPDSVPRQNFEKHVNNPLPSIGSHAEVEPCDGYFAAVSTARSLRHSLLPLEAADVYRLRDMDGDAQKAHLRQHVSQSFENLDTGALESLLLWVGRLDLNTQTGRDAAETVAATMCGLLPYSTRVLSTGKPAHPDHRLSPTAVKLLLHPDKAHPESAPRANAVFQLFLQLRRARPVVEDWFVAVPFPVRF